MDSKMMKRIIAAGLISALSAGMLAGCGKGKDDGKLTMWTPNHLNAYESSFDDVACFQMMQEENDVDVEFIHPVVGQESEQFTVMLASGDYPDIINYTNWSIYKGGLEKAIKDGVLIDLSPYINDEDMPNLSAYLKEHPECLKAMKNPDGTISVFPNIKESVEINSFIGPTLRKDWLDKLGLEVPETMDDWYNVLKAFKTQDPNGNGKADEIPFLAEGINSPYHFLSAAFGSSTIMMIGEDGNPAYGPIQPGFKDFLITLHKWYEEGLLDKDFAAADRKNLDYKMTDDIGGAYIGYTGSQMGNYIAAKKGTDFELVAAPWPKKDENSKPYCGFDGMTLTVTTNNGMGISTSNKQIEKTIQMIDWLYGEGSVALNYGVEGTSYNIVDGEYQYTDLILNNPDGKDPVAALAPYAMPNWGMGGAMTFDDSYNKIARAVDEQKYAAKIWAEGDMSLCVPALSFTTEESNAINKVKNDIDIYVMEYMTNTIIGTESVDSFDKFVKKVKDMGVDDMVNAYQAAYDRYLAN